eukprot:768204-Hanusia_phi.AAC.2
MRTPGEDPVKGGVTSHPGAFLQGVFAKRGGGLSQRGDVGERRLPLYGWFCVEKVLMQWGGYMSHGVGIKGTHGSAYRHLGVGSSEKRRAHGDDKVGGQIADKCQVVVTRRSRGNSRGVVPGFRRGCY